MEIDNQFMASSSGNENFNQSIDLKCGHELCQRTVIIRNIPFQVTQTQLWDEFAKFGKIRHAKFSSDYNGKIYSGRAEIQYFDSLTALSVLTSPRDKLSYFGRYLKPTICCTRSKKDTRRKVNGDVESPLQCHFDKLSDELINYIFSFLKFDKRIGVERVCKRWLFVNTKISWLNFRVLNFRNANSFCKNNYLTDQILASILKRCGTTLNEIDFKYANHRLTNNYLMEIAKYCPKLEYADLSDIPISTEAIKIFVEECKNLHTLKLIRIPGFDEKALSWVLKKGKNIKHLDIGFNADVTGQSFHLVNDCLETLILDSCYDLTNASFLQLRNSHIRHLNLGSASISLTNILIVVKSLKATLTELQLHYYHILFGEQERFLDVIRNCQNLQYLNLRYNNLVNEQVIALISTTCLQLCHLDLSGNALTDYDLLSLSKLPRLQTLILNYTPISGHILTELSLSGKLQKVDVCDCASIGDSGCLALIKNCPGLQLLSVCRCRNVTDSIVHEALVSKKPNNPKLKILAAGSSVRNFVNNDIVCIEM